MSNALRLFLATVEDAIDLDEDGVPIMEWEVGAPIIYEDDNENDFDDINDSDGNDISEIDDYEDDNNESDDDDINDSDGNEAKSMTMKMITKMR